MRSWGLDPSWSRRVSIPGADGRPVDLHGLDTGPGIRGTIVCVHGNPTWSYLWRDLLEQLSPEWRVIAIDQVGMGFSERGRPRRLAERIEELVTFCHQEVEGPLVLAAHDWGGPVAVGAAGQLDVEALVLANTAVAKPDDVAVPPLIATARKLVDLSCRRTPTFVAGTARMSDRRHRDALRAPYRGADRREAVRDFVADIPVVESDPSFDALQGVAEVLEGFERPVLILWGGRDPVFHDRFLRDLRSRAPHAEVERLPKAAHLSPLDEPIGALVAAWLDRPSASKPGPGDSTGSFRSVLSALDERSDDPALIYQGPDGSISWSELHRRSAAGSAVLSAAGMRPGDRTSLLIPPSVDLLVAAASIWRAGGTPVVADASSGIPALRRLVRAAAPRFIVGTRLTALIARTMRFAPGAKVATIGRLPGAVDLRHARPGSQRPRHEVRPHDVAAIVHTSGATGPAKAVRYTHGALAAQRQAMGDLLGHRPGDAFTTSFGPFMLLALPLEMTCVRPDFPVDEPTKLGFDELDAALRTARVTTAWLSPASARAISATAKGRTVLLDLVMLAGAPIPADLVRSMASITGADVRAPYGMTECLPVTDGSEPERTGLLGGASTGLPVPGCSIIVEPLDGIAGEAPTGWGEILVGSAWMFDGYDGGWAADAKASVMRGGERFHRTGDVGYFEDGLLMHLGRRAHVIETVEGVLASVAVEEPASRSVGRPCAAVGIGPSGAEALVIVVSSTGALRLSDPATAETVRASMPYRIAAVLEGELNVDRRHQSKVDRTALGRSAGALLEGR